MQVERDVQRLGPVEQRREVGMIQEPACRQAVDHGARERQLTRRPFQLPGRGLWIGRGQPGEAVEPRGMPLDQLGQGEADVKRLRADVPGQGDGAKWLPYQAVAKGITF